jgi:hypothetical protein
VTGIRFLTDIATLREVVGGEAKPVSVRKLRRQDVF